MSNVDGQPRALLIGAAGLCPDREASGLFFLGFQSSRGRVRPRGGDQEWMVWQEEAASLHLGKAPDTRQRRQKREKVGE